MPTSLPLSACCLLKSHHLPAVIPNEFWPFCTYVWRWLRTCCQLAVVVVIVQCWWWWIAGLYVLGITSTLLVWTKTNTKHLPSNKIVFVFICVNSTRSVLITSEGKVRGFRELCRALIWKKNRQHFKFFFFFLSASVLIANTTATHDVQEMQRQNFWPADGALWDSDLRSVGLLLKKHSC